MLFHIPGFVSSPLPGEGHGDVLVVLPGHDLDRLHPGALAAKLADLHVGALLDLLHARRIVAVASTICKTYPFTAFPACARYGTSG